MMNFVWIIYDNVSYVVLFYQSVYIYELPFYHKKESFPYSYLFYVLLE